MSDDDTEPLLVPPAEPAVAARGAMPRELNPPSKRPMTRWSSRTYEFASPESALLYVAVVAISSGGWPTVELRGTRVRLHAGSGVPEEHPSRYRAWSGWAERLGGAEVVEPSKPENRI